MPETNDMANAALLLDQEIDKRIATALLRFFSKRNTLKSDTAMVHTAIDTITMLEKDDSIDPNDNEIDDAFIENQKSILRGVLADAVHYALIEYQDRVKAGQERQR